MMRRINQFLHSQAAVLLLLALALLAQTPHTAAVFQRLAGDSSEDWWRNAGNMIHAGSYAIALEFATLLFVVRGKRNLAWLFAGVSVLANLAYYWTDGIAYVSVEEWRVTADGWRALLISLALPACIAFYSHDVAAQDDTNTDTDTDTNTDTAKPKRTRRTKQTITQADTEALLDGINLDTDNIDNADNGQAIWQAAYADTGAKMTADKLTAQRLGLSASAIRARRTKEQWQPA